MEPMHLEIAAETELFLLACLLGAGMGIIYDFFRVIRNTVRHNKAFVFVEDFVYTMMFGFAFFLFGTGLTGGMRGFVLVGMILGCIVERFTVGNGFVLLLSKITKFIWKIIFEPLNKIVAKCFKAIHKRIVKKHLKFQKSKKNLKKPLKV